MSSSLSWSFIDNSLKKTHQMRMSSSSSSLSLSSSFVDNSLKSDGNEFETTTTSARVVVLVTVIEATILQLHKLQHAIFVCSLSCKSMGNGGCASYRHWYSTPDSYMFYFWYG
jgi:hypothetical protein